MILPNEKIIFMHIPKTGGVSVENFFLEKYGYERNPFLLIHGYGVGLNTNKSKYAVYPHMHYSLKEIVIEAKKNKIIVDNSWTIFSIVRNPYYKFLSDLMYQDVTPLKYQFHTLPEVNKKDYINYCIDLYLKSDTNENYHSNHARPQYQFFEECDLECKIFKFEEGLINIIESLGFDTGGSFPHYLDPSQTFNIPKPNYSKMLTRQLIEVVNKEYKKDFEIYNYSMLNPLDFN